MALVLASPRRRALVALVVAFVALSTPSLAAATPVHLAPPVIHESFTPLPCTQSTTIGLEGCAEEELLTADRHVNEEVRLLFTNLPAKGERHQFVTAEDLWLTYRDADCASDADIDHGGTLEPVLFADCEVVDDHSRSADLRREFQQLEQGATSTPAWP